MSIATEIKRIIHVLTENDVLNASKIEVWELMLKWKEQNTFHLLFVLFYLHFMLR